MPELPEVETVCAGMRKALSGSVFTKVQTFRDNLRFPLPEDFAGRLEGRQIKGISRRAKYILIHLDHNTTLLAHLGMSGRMVVYPAFRNQRKIHDHIIFLTNDGKELVFNDPRRFGMMDITASDAVNEHKSIKNLGLEPLEEIFNGKALHAMLKNRKVAVKQAIMNANLVVGVGNIYACESLFRSGILPDRAAHSLNLAECEHLVKNIKQVLEEAIIAGGSTLKDYVASSGEPGYFQHNFKVYGREGKPCLNCNTTITRIVQGGRSTFCCRVCQC